MVSTGAVEDTLPMEPPKREGDRIVGCSAVGRAFARMPEPEIAILVKAFGEDFLRHMLTDAAQEHFAHEGQITRTCEYRGIFAWAVLDVLRNGCENNDRLIELSELVRHVQKVVLALRKGSRGPRRSSSRCLVFRFGTVSGDFALVKGLQ